LVLGEHASLRDPCNQSSISAAKIAAAISGDHAEFRCLAGGYLPPKLNGFTVFGNARFGCPDSHESYIMLTESPNSLTCTDQLND
jgi:hypothetical protein